MNPNGGSTTTGFDYGLTTAYGSTIAAATLTGTTAQAITATVTGLTCNMSYHARARGTNSGGTTLGGDVSFTTATCPPNPLAA